MVPGDEQGSERRQREMAETGAKYIRKGSCIAAGGSVDGGDDETIENDVLAWTMLN